MSIFCNNIRSKYTLLMIQFVRKIILLIWVLAIVALAYYLHLHRDLLDPENFFAWFQSFGALTLVAYIAVFFLRGLVLLPSMPLVLVGTLFFPENHHLVFFISMLWIIFSSAIIYEFSDIMGFDEAFAKHKHSKRVEKAIEKYGFWVILVWSFVPVVPTDLISYVAGTIRYHFWKFILALTIGESIIVGIIIYGGWEILPMFG